MTTNVHEIYPPAPDLDAAIDFLKTTNPDGRQMLVGYTDENGAPDTRHKLFEPGQWDQKRTLITLWASERRNIWVLPNEPKAGSLTGKEDDIAFIRAIWSDTDNKGIQAQAVATVDDPFRVSHAAFVTDSGAGIHTFWVLDTPVPADDRAKALAELVGRGLQEAFGGDPVWNINRPMRVPGTVNYLSAKKRAKGRQIAPTFVLASGDARVTLDQMALDFPATGGAKAKSTVTDEALKRAMSEIDTNRADGNMPEPLRKRLLASKSLSGLWGSGVVSGDTSESGHLFRLALICRDEGFTGTEFAILAAAWGKLSAKHLEHRALARAWAGASEGAQARRVFDDVVPPPDDEEEAGGEGWALVPAGEKDEKALPRREWLYWRRLIRGYLSSTVAAGGTGKSSLTMTEAVAMASGRNLLGIPAKDMPGAPLRVLIWNGEDPAQELDLRLAAIMKHHGVSKAELGGRLFMVSGRDRPLVEQGAMKKLAKTIRALRIDVVMIDPFVSSHSEPENDNGAIDRVAKRWSRLAEECRVGVDLVHHIRKPVNGGAMDLSVDDARGASALINASRNARVLSPMPEPTARGFGVSNRKAYFAIQHDATKANMAPSATGASWFRFVSVLLDNGEPFGTPAVDGDTVGVIEAWTPPAAAVDSPEDILKAQAEIAKRPRKLHPNAGNWVGKAVAGALGMDEEIDKKQIVALVKKWVKDGWLVVENRQDEHREWKDFINVGKAPEVEKWDTEVEV